MEDPLQEIGSVVHKLCQGAPKVQREALETYFTEDAAFFHPLCRVDSAPGSRNRLLGIFQWYKIMSPKIELDIQSVAYDEIKQILYVTIHQVFAIWFLFGLSHADVVLTTKLQLVKRGSKYYVQSQNDLYQVDQWIKFITLRGTGAYFVMLWHWISTIMCVLLSYVFSPVLSAEQWYADKGRKQIKHARAKSVQQLADEARDHLLQHAEETKRAFNARVNGAKREADRTGTQQFGKMQVVDSK